MAYRVYQDRHLPHNLPWPVNDMQDEYSRPEYVLPNMSMDRVSGLHMDVMERFFQQGDRPFLKPITIEPDFAMHSHPGIPADMMEPVDSDGSFYSHRYPSPANSGQSSYFSSDVSDREPAPWSSPESTIYSPESVYADSAMLMGGHTHFNGHCALHEVQAYADTQPEKFAFEEDDHLQYGNMIQEGYQPIPVHANHVEEPVIPCDTENPSEAPPEQDPVIRRRRAPSQRAALLTSSPPARVSKRTSTTRRPSTSTKSHTRTTPPPPHDFPCPFAQYGCTSKFGSKNEWKRHALTQHMRLGFWRCDQCPCIDRKPNDFNRKDLFTQHVRRMHLPPTPTTATKATSPTNKTRPPSSVEDETLANAANRCYRTLRAPPKQSGCTFCPARFTNWDERMEHVGRHLESVKKPTPRAVKKEKAELDDTLQWRCDEDTEKWLLEEKLLVRAGGKLVFADARRA